MTTREFRLFKPSRVFTRNDAGRPRTGKQRRRLLAWAVVAAACSIASQADRHSFAQNIVVSGGDVQSNSTPTTYDSIDVSGTDGSSNPSTYNANAALTLTGNLNAHDSGVFNANADVNAGGRALNYAGGVINLNAGTLSAQQLLFEGEVNQAGGHYATNDLHLSPGVSLKYSTGDSVTSRIESLGGNLTLEKNLALTDSLSLSGGSFSRTTETISARYLVVSDLTFNLRVGDTFDPSSRSSVYYGGVVNASAGTSLPYFQVNGYGSLAHPTLNVNGNFTVANSADVVYGGIINLNAGTISARALFCRNGGSLNQAGGNYATEFLWLSDGAALTYGSGDSITTGMILYGGSTLTLTKDLSLTGDIQIGNASTSLNSSGHAISAGNISVTNDATLTLDQNLTLTGFFGLSSGGSIARTIQTISAKGFSVSDATLNLLAGDTFTPSSIYASSVTNGGVVNAPAGTAFAGLNVYSTNGAGHHATFNVNGDVTIAGSAKAFSDGIINLNSGTLSAHSLTLTGAGAAGQAGGHFAVSDLLLSSGVSLSYLAGDSVDNLTVDGAGSLLDELNPLSLTSLSLTGGGILHLGAFTGSGPVSNWALSLSGDDTSLLESLIAGGSITGGSGPLVVTYDSGSNATFVSVTAVPEPSTYAMALAGLACGGWQILRRRRSR
ncbi:MAG: PEP-CTERM sorting domain-containing protein [Planctomycetia bacterium]